VRREAGAARASALVFLTLVLLAVGAAWWFLVPAESDPLPELRSALTEALTTPPFASDEAEEEPRAREATVDANLESPDGVDEGLASSLPGTAHGAGATGSPSAGSPSAEARSTGAAAPGEDPLTAASGGNGEPDPFDHVFTPMDAASRSRDEGAAFDPGLAPDSMVLEIDGFRIPYEIFAIYVTPGHSAEVTLAGPEPEDSSAADAELYAEAGRVTSTGPQSWTWEAPADPGVYRLDVARQRSGEAIRLNAFVLTPYSDMGSDGDLGGYRIGAYPEDPLRGLAQYLPPPGFIQVTPENRELLLSPHFTLGQFLCKQAGDWPKYVTLREEMLGKLETILAAVNDGGVRADTFHVMSGYRTPFYNHAIGNVRYSRHQWGDASDIFVDVDPRDGVMDDINGDGKVSLADAKYLAKLVEGLAGTRGWKPYVGGLGIYGTTATHGPFIHVDTRGFRARWSG